MADVKWIKIVVNIFDDEKIRFIETMPNGDEIIVIWFKLLCLTGKSNSSGFLMFTNKLAYTDEMLSSIFNRDIKVIQMALQTFEMLEMIEVVDNRIYISNWEKHQNIDGLEKIRLQTKERVAKHREKQKLLDSNVTCNVTVTQSNAIDIEEEKEIEKELDKEKKKKETYKSIVSRYTQNSYLVSSLNDYIEMRKKIKGFTVRALELALSKLDKLTSDDDEKIMIVNNAVMNGWKSFYPLKEENRKEIVPEWVDNTKSIETSQETKIKALKLQLELGSINEQEYEEQMKELNNEQMDQDEIDSLLSELKSGAF